MTTLLEEAIARLKALPEDRQDAAAAATLDVIAALEDEADGGLSPEEWAEALRRARRPPSYADDAEVEAFFAGNPG